MEIKFIILFILVDWAIKAVFAEWLYAWVDAKLYGWYEKQPPQPPFGKGGSVHWFLRWLFKERDVKIFGYVFRNGVPRYRVFQKVILIGYWTAMHFMFYVHFPWYAEVISLAGVLGAYYFMKFERRYYYWAGQEEGMYDMELNRVNVYWLARIWFSGYWLFPNGYRFRGWVFDASSLAGTVILYLLGAVGFVLI